MVIEYEDEYGTSIYWGKSDHLVNVGDTITVKGEEYRVKSRKFDLDTGKVFITVTDGPIRSQVAESKDNGRQNQMHNAIIELTKRQDVVEKKHRALGDQLSVVRHSVNTRIKQDKKDKQE